MTNATHDELTPEAEFAEDLARLLDEATGLPRIAGRIFAALLTTEQPYLSGPEIARQLQISSGSVSTMTRLLEGKGLIERYSRPRIRADLFRIRVDHWQASLSQAAETSRGYQRLAEKFLPVTESAIVRTRLSAYRDFYQALGNVLTDFAGAWRAKVEAAE